MPLLELMMPDRKLAVLMAGSVYDDHSEVLKSSGRVLLVPSEHDTRVYISDTYSNAFCAFMMSAATQQKICMLLPFKKKLFYLKASESAYSSKHLVISNWVLA